MSKGLLVLFVIFNVVFGFSVYAASYIRADETGFDFSTSYDGNILPGDAGFDLENQLMYPFFFIPARMEDYIPPQYDATEGHSKKGSYRITYPGNYKGQNLTIQLPVVVLDKNKEYTISFSFKGSVPGINLLLKDNRMGKTLGSFKTSTKWQRVSYTGTFKGGAPPKFPGCYSFAFRIIGGGNLKKGAKIWIDDLCVAEGSSKEFIPPKAAISITPDKKPAIYTMDEKANIKIALSSEQTRLKVAVKIENMVSGRIIYDKTSDVSMSPKTNKKVLPLITLAPRRGAFKITCTVSKGKMEEKREKIIGWIKDLSQTKNPDFFYGIHPILHWPIMFKDNKNARKSTGLVYYCTADFDTFEKYLEIAAKTGFKSARVFNVLSPNAVAMEKDNYKFADADYIIDKILKYKFDILGVLGSWGMGMFDRMPDYWKSDKKAAGRLGGYLPDIDEYGKYIEKVVSHYRGKIKHYEGWNEPNRFFSPEEFMPYVKVAYKAIKKADPKATVVGICATSDFNNDVFGFFKAVQEKGAYKWFDKIAIHSYSHSIKLHPDPNINDGYFVKRIYKMIKKYSRKGQEVGVWDTESGNFRYSAYSHEKPIRSCNRWLREKYAPNPVEFVRYRIMSLMSLRAYGAERSYYFHFTSYQVGPYDPGFALVEYDGAPTSLLIAYNVMIENFYNVTLLKELNIDSRLICYLFKRQDGKRLAFLVNLKERPLEVKLPQTANKLKIIDAMGEPAELSRSKVLTLKRLPVYIIGDDLEGYLKQARPYFKVIIGN